MTTAWTTPEDITARLRRCWDRGEILTARLGAPSIFPLTFGVQRPTSREMTDRFAEARAWLGRLEGGSRAHRGFGYDIEWESVNFRVLGRNDVPRKVVVPSEADALALLGLGSTSARWEAHIQMTLESFPASRNWLRDNSLKVVDFGDDWERVLGILRWFVSSGQRGDVFLRQIDVPGVDTKFIEARRALLSALLDQVLPADRIDRRAVGAKGFESRYGLRSKPRRLRIRSLDEGLDFGGLRDVEAPVSEWAQRPLPVDRLILVENEVNFLSFPALRRSAIVFGGGYSVIERVPEVTWFRDRLLFYWGDIDRNGLVILDGLRSSFPHVRSFLMDRETLLDHRPLWGIEENAPEVALERLTEEEHELHEDLRRHRFGYRVRLEQERIGFRHVRRAIDWIQRASAAPFRRRTARGFVFDAEDAEVSGGPESWVDTARMRNWILEDPVLDWLDSHGREAGYEPDDDQPGFDPRIDARQFFRERKARFVAEVQERLSRDAPLKRIGRRDDRSVWVEETLVEARAGSPLIAGGLLADPLHQVYAETDLLVRSDVLEVLFPGSAATTAIAGGAVSPGVEPARYVAVLLSDRSLDLTADGQLCASGEQLVLAVKGWFQAQALRAMSGVPAQVFVLGREWLSSGSGQAAAGVARLDVERWLPQRECALADVARSAAAWLRRLRRSGGAWRVLPRPSVPELYPHARNHQDSPWHATKRALARQLEDLTLLPGMNPERRLLAHEAGLFRWRQDGVSAAALGVTSPVVASQLDAVVEANRSPVPTVVPARIIAPTDGWRLASAVEFFVDVETLVALESTDGGPERGGRVALIQIGCGHVRPDGAWSFAQWTADSTSGADDLQLLDAWITHMEEVCREAGATLGEARLCHWSGAEPAALDALYAARRVRISPGDRPDRLPWFDLLQEVVRAAPIGVTGAFSYGLKEIGRAMHQAGFVQTTWPAGVADGLAATIGICRAATETDRLAEHPFLREVAGYNEADCRIVMEVLHWLREHR